MPLLLIGTKFDLKMILFPFRNILLTGSIFCSIMRILLLGGGRIGRAKRISD